MTPHKTNAGGTGVIDQKVRIGHVHLKVADLDRGVNFIVAFVGSRLQFVFGDDWGSASSLVR